MKLTETVSAVAIQLQHDFHYAEDYGVLRGKAGEWLVRYESGELVVVKDLAGYVVADQSETAAEAELRAYAEKHRR